VGELRDIAEAVDLLVIPTTPDMLSLKALQLTLATLKEIEGAKFKVLLTIVPPRPNHDADDARTLLAESRIPVFKADVPRLVAFQKAALAGVPVYDAPDARAAVAWEAYREAGREIAR
jgi:chromosome partitioning protein